MVEKLETKGLGAKSNTKRKYTEAEFKCVLSSFRQWDDFEHKIQFVLMTIWSYHLIHRIDDTCHFKMGAPHGSVEFPFTIKTRTTWSKNVTSMQNCQDQVLLGSDESNSYVQLWLSIYLELYLADHPSSKFLFTDKTDEEKAPLNLKQRYRSRINKVVWKTEEFQALADETGDEAKQGVGTHSTRKYASTLAKLMGADDSQVEHRGRWVGETGRRVCSRVYISSTDTYTDAFVASLLCKGGAIRYELQEDLLVTDNWLYMNVIPHIYARFHADNRFCRVMALCYLWAVFDPENSEYLPAVDVDRIKTAFASTYGAAAVEVNPVKKIKISVVKINGTLDIVDIDTDRAPGTTAGASAVNPVSPAGIGNSHEMLGYLQRMERSLAGELQSVRVEQAASRKWMGEQIDKVITNQRRFGGTIGQALNRQSQQRQARNRSHAAAVATQRAAGAFGPTQEIVRRVNRLVTPERDVVHQGQEATRTARATNAPVRLGINPHAKLAGNPRSLHEYWEEFMFGIGDNKAAKDFTTDKVNGQGASFKNKYSRRLKIWRLQSYLINCGFNIEAANGRIVEVYGTDKPTPLQMIITRDQKNSNFPFVGQQRFNPRIVVNTG